MLKYISVLIDLKILEKVTPLKLEAKSRKSIYKIKDIFLRFWYRFVFSNKTLIEQGLVDEVIENKIKPFINEFIGEVYEQICMDYLKILNKKKRLPFIFENIGKWWGNNPYKKREEEIDIVAFDSENMLLCECKWRNQKVDMSVLNSLIEKSVIFNHRKKFYVLFSKSGFTDELISFARQNPHVLLINEFEI